MAFIPTGLVKATGNRFTALPISNPIGFFFEALYQTGAWWHFIGVVQISAGVLLLIPATATIGAILCLPIALSILLITWGMGFTGTVYVSAGMMLSVAYLLCWDADRIWSASATVFGGRPKASLLEGATPVEKIGWGLGGSVGIALLLVTRGFVPPSWTGGLLLVGLAAVGLVLAGWILGAVRGRAERRR